MGTRGGGGFLDRLAPLLLLGAVVAAAYYGQFPTMALAATLLFALLLTRWWGGHSLDRVSYRRTLSDDRAFPGDELSLDLGLANDKLLPLPWVEIEDRVPASLLPTPEGGAAVAGGAGGTLRLAGSVAWKERVTWNQRLLCRRRGVYTLGPATVGSGDPFGFFPRSSPMGGTTRLVVYPRLLELDRLDLPPGFPLGERKAERWIFQDPSRTVGVRDYRREDSFRRIHWKATARRQELQVKLHEPTTTLETALFLALDGFFEEAPAAATGGGATPPRSPEVDSRPSALPTAAPSNGTPTPRVSSHAFEYAVSLAASLARQMVDARDPVGLYVNGGEASSRLPMEIPPGSGQDQLLRILEFLAGVEPAPCLPIESFVSQVAPRLPWGSSVVVVTGKLSEALRSTLVTLARSGRKPMVLLAATVPLEDRGDIPVHVMGAGLKAFGKAEGRNLHG